MKSGYRGAARLVGVKGSGEGDPKGHRQSVDPVIPNRLVLAGAGCPHSLLGLELTDYRSVYRSRMSTRGMPPKKCQG